MELNEVLDVLRARGALPLTRVDGWPCLTELVAGGPVAGSWWGHPAGAAIFSLAGALEDHPDVLATRLVEGKVTFVHRALWPALYRVAIDPPRRARLVSGLSATASSLLDRVSSGPLRLDQVPATDKLARKALSDAATRLERDLLVVSEQIHTEQGRHSRRLQTFESWASAETKALAATSSLEDALIQLSR